MRLANRRRLMPFALPFQLAVILTLAGCAAGGLVDKWRDLGIGPRPPRLRHLEVAPRLRLRWSAGDSEGARGN